MNIGFIFKKLGHIKLHSRQLLAEVFRLIEEDRSKAIFIYDDNHFIGKVSYQEVIAFLDYKKSVGDIYQHKLNFEMGTVLHIIRGMRTQGELMGAPGRPDAKTIVLRLTSVAVLLTIILGVAWLFFRSSDLMPANEQVAAEDIRVISDKAMLTISGANGINITDAKPGVLYKGAGVQVVKVGANQIEYRLTEEKGEASEGNPIHTITTPIGQHYQLTLSDGTKIWINAASSVNFPATFVALDSRYISLSGEAYLEVSSSKQPFFLVSKQQEIQVLGTHFNVTAYENDASIRTTLLEGSLKVTAKSTHKSVVLKPGQQSNLTSAGLTVTEVDAEQYVSWKEGAFIFRNERLEDVMKVLERQYNIKVVYKNQDKRASLIGGAILFSSSLPDVLHLLQKASNANLKLEGTQVTVL